MCFKCGSYLNGFGPGLADSKQTTIVSQNTDFSFRDNVVYSNFITKLKHKEYKSCVKAFDVNICDACVFNCLCLNCFERFNLKRDFPLRFIKNVAAMKKLTKLLVIETKLCSILEDCTLLKQSAEAFIYFNGSKNSFFISICSFRLLVRRCGLCDFFNLSSIENVFFEVAKEWKIWKSKVRIDDFSKSKVSSPKIGDTYVPFQGFIQVLYKVAELQFSGNNLKEKVENLIKQIVKSMQKENKKVSTTHKFESSQKIKNKKKSKEKYLELPEKDIGVHEKPFVHNLTSFNRLKNESIATFSERNYKRLLNISLFDKNPKFK